MIYPKLMSLPGPPICQIQGNGLHSPGSGLPGRALLGIALRDVQERAWEAELWDQGQL